MLDRLLAEEAVSAAFSSRPRPALTEIYLCHACRYRCLLGRRA
jgi:hypothetical protein